jgi:hypothetical protein
LPNEATTLCVITMPSRPVCLGILLFWLGFNGYLFYHDLLPRLLPGRPPPYTIDLVEEAKVRRPMIDWTVLRDGVRTYRARTSIEHPEHDVFKLNSEFAPLSGVQSAPIHGFLIEQMRSELRVNSTGDLLGMSVSIKAIPHNPLLRALIGPHVEAQFGGQVQGGRMQSTISAQSRDGKVTRNLPEVVIREGGAVLLPLHPVNRLQGLRPGQQWTIRVFDPLAAIIAAVQKREYDPSQLRARVRPRTETISWGRRNDVECLVIDYQGDDFKGATWVGKERGQVLSQEVTLDNERWVMYRD